MADPRYSEWLHGGDTGLSSEAIFHFMTLGSTGGSVPWDTSDLARCLRLLERFPEWKPRMPEMVNAGGWWPVWVKHWDEMTASFIEEVGGAVPAYGSMWRAPKTYDLMHRVYEEARDLSESQPA